MAESRNPAEAPRRRGTRPRGSRTAITVRVPDEQYARYAREAEKLGIPIGSWAAIVLAESQHFEIPQYIKTEISKAAERRNADQRTHAEELPLPKSA
jgi:hypothetical protein